jgi:hypothetical protein
VKDSPERSNARLLVARWQLRQYEDAAAETEAAAREGSEVYRAEYLEAAMEFRRRAAALRRLIARLESLRQG